MMLLEKEKASCFHDAPQLHGDPIGSLAPVTSDRGYARSAPRSFEKTGVVSVKQERPGARNDIDPHRLGGQEADKDSALLMGVLSVAAWHRENDAGDTLAAAYALGRVTR